MRSAKKDRTQLHAVLCATEEGGNQNCSQEPPSSAVGCLIWRGACGVGATAPAASLVGWAAFPAGVMGLLAAGLTAGLALTCVLSSLKTLTTSASFAAWSCSDCAAAAASSTSAAFCWVTSSICVMA